MAEVNSVPARARFDRLLEAMIDEPEREAEIEQRIEAEFACHRAVMVLDTGGFSWTTRRHGILAFLAMIHRLKRAARPVVTAFGGRIVKAEADNLFCLFETVEDAVAASQGILAALDAENSELAPEFRISSSIGIAYGRILDLAGEDLFGDAVNIACKLGEDVAERDMILVSADAYERIAQDRFPGRTEAVSISGLWLNYVVVTEPDVRADR